MVGVSIPYHSSIWTRLTIEKDTSNELREDAHNSNISVLSKLGQYGFLPGAFHGI